MHHLFPLAKGDPLCPLGFHPQVRWPTRCKRCFRDYKEHGGRKKEDDFAASTPALSSWSSPASRGRDEENGAAKEKSGRSWSSSQNLSSQDTKKDKSDGFSTVSGFSRNSASWTSTPDLNEVATAVTVSLKLPKRRLTAPLAPLDTGQPASPDRGADPPTTVTLRRPSASPPPVPAHLAINKNDSLAERVRKMQLQKAQNSFEKESSQEKERQDRRSSSRSREEEKQTRSREEERTSRSKEEEKNAKDDVNFMMQVKHARNATGSKPPVRGGPTKEKDGYLSDDDLSSAGTTTTETTLVDVNLKEYQEQVEGLKQEVDILRKRCERVEKEKSDILLRRLANLDTNKTGRSSEVLKLQQKVNDLTTQNEDLKDEKKSLSLRVKEFEAELESRPSPEVQQRQTEQLRAKLLAAETLCEELMDENEDMKKELRDLEEEIEEMQDNFREDQADEYSSLRRELEQSIKNCRVLSFKLKKSERKADQLEHDKAEQEKKLLEIAGGESGLERVARIKELETELSRSNEVALRLQRELQDANSKLSQQPANQRRNPSLAVVGKANSADGQKVSRASLTRGGSQEDPQQLLRDLQDSMEREADLREQLKNAEEEANNLRKTASRVEDDNESLLLQLKKMATKARTRKLSPTPPTNRLSIENSIEKDEGISDEEDPAELRILLELNEQEAAVLRRKVEELEHEGDSLKRQVKELTEKISSTGAKTSVTALGSLKKKTGNLAEEKVKVLEDEIAELRKKLIEKERSCERLHAELSLAQKKPKASLNKSKSLDGVSEQQNVDLKRQLQVIEQEATVLRTKTQTLEIDNERLQAENKKLQLLRGAKSLKSEKSLEQSSEKISHLETELKDALTKIKELETKEKDEKPEKKVSFGGVVTKKDVDALKVKQDELDKLKLNFNKLEKENVKLQSTLKDLKDNAIKSFKPRTPKKLTDLTTKLQMKRMVEELENEIGEMFVVMKNAEIEKSPAENNEKLQLEKDIEEVRSKLSSTESELTNEKNRLQTEIAKLKDLNEKFKKDTSLLSDKVKKIEDEKNCAVDDAKSLREEKKKLEVQINKLNTDLKNSSSKQSAMSECMNKIEDLKREMEQKDKEVEKLKKLVEVKEKLEQDKSKLLKETGDKAKKITELEKKLKESEDKFNRTEKQLNVRKDRVAKLEKELSEEKEQTQAINHVQKRMSVDFTTEKDELQTKLLKTEIKLLTLEGDMKEIVAESETKIVTLESHVAAKEFHIKQLEEALRETSNQKSDETISSVELSQIQEKLDKATRELAVKETELSSIKEEMSKHTKDRSRLQSELTTMKSDMDKLANDKKELEGNVKVQKKEADYWENKASEFETDLQAERKKVDRMRVAQEKDSKNKEAELATLKGKLRTLEQTSGAGTKKITELKQEFEGSVKKLEHSLAVERAEYEELTGKYELLEEEHVVTKAKLTIEKEAAQGELLQVQKELNTATSMLRTLQDTCNSQTDAWAKERVEMQEQIGKLQDRLCGGGWEVEKARLQAKLDQRETELRQLDQQHDVTLHQLDALKREIEDARQKLEDYEKVHKVQRNQAAQSAEMEREMKALQQRLEQAERGRKTELTECKMRYDSQMQSMQDELQSLQNQVSRFRRERDNYKQMLEQAHKSMQDLKSGDSRSKRSSISSVDEEEYRSRLLGLEQQTACLEDELCEARLAASKLKTELVSERSGAEIKLSEMQSRLNEYEEERLLSSGRSRVAGMATRMELAWQKERDEQQRLLQETSTLARDLRQTLFEMERERDKERLDMKRRIEQLKRTTEEETDENKKKVTELQCDLLELRDAHAKLRTTNEKLRRDKERHDREREQNKLLVASLKRAQQEDDRKTSYLLESIEELMKQAPDVFKQTATKPEVKTLMTPTPPRRNRSSKSRSREATPESSGEEGAGVAATLARLQRATDELKASRVVERQRRQANMRRAASTEPRDTMVVTAAVTPRPSNGRTPSLKKRSISLEQTTKEQGVIWKTVEDGSVSSIQSLDGDMDGRLFSMQRDTSLDSRLSGGSTQSDVLPSGDKKKKKGLFGKLKQLTKSRSIDDQAGPEVAEFRPIGAVSQGSDSDMSAAGSKRDIRGRLSDMFHRKGQMSRGNSKDGSRELSTPLPERSGAPATLSAAPGASATLSAPPGASAQRPLSRNSSSSNIPRAEAQTGSSNARAASTTPGVKRKGK